MENKFSWTQEYIKLWDNEGVEKKERILLPKITKYNPYKKSIVRHLHVAIDLSSSIEKSDYLPTIRNKINELMPNFVSNFFSLNPLGILSFSLHNEIFLKYSKTFDASNFLNVIGSKYFSLVNLLKTIVEILKRSNQSRECLIIISSIGTKDNTSLIKVLEDVKKANIKINIISICGEVTAFKKVCESTNGLFYVPLDSNHFEMILNSFSEPQESTETTTNLIKMGFPDLVDKMGLCCCHMTFHEELYECPSCMAFVCSIPAECPICMLQLVSSLSITRSYWSMNPLEPFIYLTHTNPCRVCGQIGNNMCNLCKNIFCTKCSEFLHKDLGFCIYCKL